MHVRVRLFAIQRELAGTREIAVDLPPGATIEDAWTAVVGLHPGLAPGRPSVRFARNAEYAPSTTTLADGDEVAFIPPVSGGGDVAVILPVSAGGEVSQGSDVGDVDEADALDAAEPSDLTWR